MTKKVFLIYPPAGIMNREDRCQQPIKDLVVIPPLPPTDLLYMASMAESVGYECKIKDYSLKQETLVDFENDIKEFKPDYIIINTTTPTLKADLDVCKIAKVTNSNIKTIAKGAHFLTFNKEVLEEFKSLDMIMVGEPELTLKEILQKKPKEEILGLCFRKGNEIIKNNLRPFNDNLDELPYPARHLVNNSIYRRPDNNKIQATIKVSRGCPFHCFFCLATPVSGHKVRARSPKNILGEIQECIEKYNIRDFLFWSDIFNLDKNWAIELCNEIIDSKLKFTWASNTRADTIDEELAKLMKKAGCTLVSIGIESGSQEMLDKMGKKTNLDQIRNTVKMFKKVGIKTYNYFVIGLPWESETTAEETIKFAVELDSDFINFYTAVAFPGTRLYEYVQENNLFEIENSEELYSNAYYYPVVKSHYLSKDRIFELHKQAVKRFHLRPKYIVKSLLNIRSFTEVKSYFLAGLSILLKK
ncbi:MAG: radical SAM protein [Candidatus Gastranaerophilales bacterium]|nr:radical SAM protein [Candidatus Gastranaerophilales bacterium]